MTTTETAFDPQKVEAFFGKLMSIYTGSMLTYMIDLGHQTGLLAAAAVGPATCEELARRAGLTERYVREWLGAVVTGGLVDYDPATETFTLPPEHAIALTEGDSNLAPIAQLQTHLGKHLHQVARAFREGGGVPYAAFRPEFTDVMDGVSRTFFDNGLVNGYVPLVPGLQEQLESGIRVADVCCGTGHALVLLARAFPHSTFCGYDLDDGAIARARAEAAGAGLKNVTFLACDAATLHVDEPFDAIFVFDAIHDQVRPDAVLARINAALAPGGVFVMKEPHAGDTLAENLANPMATIMYGTSTLHCLTVSLAHDGAGIGTAFGEGLAKQMLADARFVDIEVHATPNDPMNSLYISRKAS